MLRALARKSSGNHTKSSDASVASGGTESRQRRRSRSPFRRVRGRSRSKSRGRDRKKSQSKSTSSKGGVKAAAAAAATSTSTLPIGIASPEPTLGGAGGAPFASPPSAASTACSSVASSASRSPYEQADDDAFLRMQTEKYNQMMVETPKETSSSSTDADENTAPQDSNDSSPLMGYLHGKATAPHSRSRSAINTSSFGGIKEEDEDALSDNEDEVGLPKDTTSTDDTATTAEAEKSKKVVTFKASTAAASPDRFLHHPTAGEHKLKSPSANSTSKVTFAADDIKLQHQGQHRVFLLLLEPNKKVFELIQVEYAAKTATIGYILSLIKVHASEPALARQKHVGLIRPRDETELTNVNMLAFEGRIKHGEVLIPLPKDCRSSKCRRLAKTILKTPNVVKLLSKDEPLSSRPRRRSRSRSRRSVSPGRSREGALKEASNEATKALEAKIEELEKRLSTLAGSKSSDENVSEEIRKEIEEKARARAEIENKLQEEAKMSAAERIEQMAQEAESEKPSLRSQAVNPMSFSFDSEDVHSVDESNPPPPRRDLISRSEDISLFVSLSDLLSDGVAVVKPQLRRLRNTAKSFKTRLKRSRKKPLVRAASVISMGVVLVSFLYGYFGGDSTINDLSLHREQQSIRSVHAIVGLIMGGSFIVFLAASFNKATARTRGGASGRSGPKKKSRMLRGAAIVRSVPARDPSSRRKTVDYGSNKW